MKTILLLLLMSCLWLPALCRTNDDLFVIVTVQGSAFLEPDRNPEPIARNDAKRNAVEQVMGAYLRSETRTESSRLVLDSIVSKVEGYAVVVEGPFNPQRKNEIYSAEYRVKVFLQRSGTPSGLLEDLKARGLFRAIRTAVYIQGLRPAEEALGNALRDYGFKQIDWRGQSVGVGAADPFILKERFQRAGGIDLLIVGEAQSERAPTPSIARGSRFSSYRAQVTVRAIWTDTWEELASVSVRGIPVADLSEAIARDSAYERAAEQAVRLLMPEILQAAAFSPGKVSRLVELHVSNIDSYTMAQKIRLFLENMEGVQEVVRFQFQHGRVSCELNMSENGRNELAEQLERMRLSDNAILRVKSLSENKIEVEATKSR